jgi:hypothetical protein
MVEFADFSSCLDKTQQQFARNSKYSCEKDLSCNDSCHVFTFYYYLCTMENKFLHYLCFFFFFV